MKKFVVIILIIFISCKAKQVTSSEEKNTVEIIACGPTPLKEQTRKIFFKNGSEELLEDYTTEIIAISKIIKSTANDFSFEISGHTDSVGSKDLNLKLSQKRAEKIKELLIAQGCKSSRLMAKGYGETRPLVSNSTKRGRQQNRRIEISMIKL